jgi:septum site-determining protein MinC
MVAIKGTRNGLLIQLEEGEWNKILDDLTAQVTRPQARSFFRGAQVSIDSGARALTVNQVTQLSNVLAQQEMTLVVLTGSAEETQALARELKLQPLPPPPAPTPAPHTAVLRGLAPPHYTGEGAEGGSDSTEVEALMIRRTIRSGQVIRYEGHIVVYGDVNPGAEIIAGGDIFVWGKLRGVVHAGALGNDNAFVSALYLAPTQLRIGGHIARAPDEKKRKTINAETARVRDGKIIVENWSAGK